MEQKLNILNKFILTIALISIVIVLVEVIHYFPKVAESTKQLNAAQCLESYNNQGQPPLGACGFDF